MLLNGNAFSETVACIRVYAYMSMKRYQNVNNLLTNLKALKNTQVIRVFLIVVMSLRMCNKAVVTPPIIICCPFTVKHALTYSCYLLASHALFHTILQRK